MSVMDLMSLEIFHDTSKGIASQETRREDRTSHGHTTVARLLIRPQMSSLQTVPTLKKYGLQKRSGTKKHAPDRSSSASSSALSFFNTDLEDEEDEDDQQSSNKGEKNLNSRAQIRNHLNLQRSNHKLMQASSNTIPTLTAEEAKIFDYDGSYDDYKELEKDKFGKSMNLLGKDEPVRLIVSSASDPSVSLLPLPSQKSRYINKIQATALVREKEKDRIYERFSPSLVSFSSSFPLLSSRLSLLPSPLLSPEFFSKSDKRKTQPMATNQSSSPQSTRGSSWRIRNGKWKTS
jgi:hypothetical protein